MSDSMPVVAEVVRGGLVEARYRGAIVAVTTEGRVLASMGDPEHVTYLRSSAKPVQALPVIESGAADHFGFTEPELAVIAASHNGEPIHVEAVSSILRKIGLGVEYLRCGAHLPYGSDAAAAMLRSGEAPTALHNNCSGKHSGMLAVCVLRGWPLETYQSPDHPLQQEILATLAGIADVPSAGIIVGTDGCGVPCFGLPLRQEAQVFARLISPEGLAPRRQAACRRIVRAMQRYPEMTSGTHGRLSPTLMRLLGETIFLKAGAEGILCGGLAPGAIPGYPSAAGLTIKIEDGGFPNRGRDPVIIAALRQLGVLTEVPSGIMAEFGDRKMHNHPGQVVGEVRSTVRLAWA